jgi:hypothetical protein
MVQWRWLDELIGRLTGKNVGVLGERGVGKTHLQTFLRERRIPGTYTQTLVQERMKASRATMLAFESFEGPSMVKLALRSGFDVPGSAEAVEAWKEVVERSSILLYLFRADLAYKGDTAHLRRITDDSTLISKFIDERDQGGEDMKVVLVGTHYDQIVGFPGADAGSTFYEWHQHIHSTAEIGIARLVLGRSLSARPGLVVGSMRTLKDTQEMAFRIFAKELRL